MCLVFALPFSIAARWAADNDNGGLATALVLAAVPASCSAAGVRPGSSGAGSPLTHGVVTAARTYLAAQAVFVVVRLVRGDDVQLVQRRASTSTVAASPA